jgi:hypothetical protein
MADAFLPAWTPMGLARGEAYWHWDSVRAEEAARTSRGIVAARPCTPAQLTATYQPRGTRRVLVSGNPEAPLAFLALASGDAEPHQWPIACGCKVTTSLTTRALRICHALAVSAILRQEPGVRQTAEGRFAVRAQPAVAAVGAQSSAAFRIQQGTDHSAARSRFRYLRPQRGVEQCRQRQGEKQARENSERHTPVHPPHFCRHSSVYFLVPPQNRS